MKKNRIIAVLGLAALFMTFITACSANNSTAGVKHTFLIATVDGESINTRGEFEDAAQHGIGISSSNEVLKDLENSTLINPLNGQEMKYAYSDCTYKSKETKEYGMHYSVYDVYTSGVENIEVLHGTDLVCFYFNSQRDNSNPVWPKDADPEALAASFLTALIGGDILSKFDSVTVTLYEADAFAGTLACAVKYTRTMYGHKTDENLIVYIDKSGNIAGYNGYNLCKYDSLKDKFNNERIQLAKDLLTEKITALELKNLKVNEPVITTNIDGDLYMEVSFSCEDEDGIAYKETAYVNVN